MKWNHILDIQPEEGSIIIQIDAPYELYDGDFKNHYILGMRKYKTYCSWEHYTKWREENNVKLNFWWIYAKDFPLPEESK